MLKNSILAFLPILLALSIPLSLEAKKLKPYAEIKDKDINECSGIVKSRQFESVYWVHNDSGDDARIFAITRKGKSIKSQSAIRNGEGYEGIAIENAKNTDWEDIAVDDKGNLLIGDFGNNDNERRDLAIYIVPEPDPAMNSRSQASKRIEFHYPDQKSFPEKKNSNFDCEAFFFANGKIYFLTKHRSDTMTKLYRLDTRDTQKSNALTLLGSFDIKDQATGADATADARKLAVLTYDRCWVFVAPVNSDNYFDGDVFNYSLQAKQCEAICWKNDQDLIIANEQSELFEIDTADFKGIEKGR